MPFEIEEANLKPAKKSSGRLMSLVSDLDDLISKYLSNIFGKVFSVFIVLFVIALLIFFIGSIVGILIFGWNQL